MGSCWLTPAQDSRSAESVADAPKTSDPRLPPRRGSKPARARARRKAGLCGCSSGARARCRPPDAAGARAADLRGDADRQRCRAQHAAAELLELRAAVTQLAAMRGGFGLES